MLRVERHEKGAKAMKMQFRDCVIDSDLAQIESGGQTNGLTPQTLRLLNHLIRNRHRVVSKDELISKVWGDRIISDASLSTAIKETRQAWATTGAASTRSRRCTATDFALWQRSALTGRTADADARARSSETAARRLLFCRFGCLADTAEDSLCRRWAY